ncbi:carboxylesterase family protein [Kibdelosporangium philippinense]|uniref:Carboxylic ester hydrolase n=1 Tax=Kibdelosporangium philippinense TaxID=211113 RepID=A0ABS8ZFV8_9PSEU|nr:carboxylesterase family protein [Kibdelosporangium philippinense]MCE7005800.1 carboxylesterase family protein [Kibdelosporangium philippinense]
MKWRGVVLATIGLLGLVAGPANAGPATLVFTDRGPVQGAVTGEVRLFRGIPFAQPPVGELRWRAPQPAKRWREPLDTSKPRDPCAQPPLLLPEMSVNEDCLYLNVTTPKWMNRPLPVMVWFHGGYFLAGAPTEYDPVKLVTQGDVIVVTVAYRLGALGYLATPDLTAEAGNQSGNYAFQDQLAGLRWVQRNAAAFGGNPGNVTVFGESAGAASVCDMVVSPLAKGLFHKAIGQRYSCDRDTMTPQQAYVAGAQLSSKVGCADVVCLRDKPVKDLLTAWPGGMPVVGGRELPLQRPDAIKQGKYNQVPVVWGNNQHEGRLFVGMQYDGVGKPVTVPQYEQITRDTFGPAADKVLDRYPVGDYASPSIALATWQTDSPGVMSTCSHLNAYTLFSAKVPMYAYQFADRTAPVMFDWPNFDEGAMHGSELNYLWNRVFGPPLNPVQEVLSRTMVRYWTTFAHTGNPNRRAVPEWKRHKSAGDVQELGVPMVGPKNPALESNCAFWAALQPLVATRSYQSSTRPRTHR